MNKNPEKSVLDDQAVYKLPVGRNLSLIQLYKCMIFFESKVGSKERAVRQSLSSGDLLLLNNIVHFAGWHTESNDRLSREVLAGLNCQNGTASSITTQEGMNSRADVSRPA